MARIAFVILRGKTTYQKSQCGGRSYGSRVTKSQGGTAPIEDAPGIMRTCEIGRLNVLHGGRARGSIARSDLLAGFGAAAGRGRLRVVLKPTDVALIFAELYQLRYFPLIFINKRDRSIQGDLLLAKLRSARHKLYIFNCAPQSLVAA